MSQKTPPQQLHVPVLLQAVIDVLAPKKDETYLDLTAGYGGHASAVIGHIGNASLATLVDRDQFAIANLEHLKNQGARIIKSDFAAAARQLSRSGEQFDMILIDLGVSSPQLDNADRGFSISKPGPLDMRMDASQPLTAADIVNTYSENELAQTIRDFGEEPRARAIARSIVLNRPLYTTDQLSEVINSTIRGKRGRTHPATRTFQAIRIALNDELGQLKQTLPLLPSLLRPGGRVGIISFHSLEDRLVKQYFTEQHNAGYEAELQILTKKPIDGAAQDVHNPRARSAKLRAAVKIKR